MSHANRNEEAAKLAWGFEGAATVEDILKKAQLEDLTRQIVLKLRQVSPHDRKELAKAVRIAIRETLHNMKRELKKALEKAHPEDLASDASTGTMEPGGWQKQRNLQAVQLTAQELLGTANTQKADAVANCAKLHRGGPLTTYDPNCPHCHGRGFEKAEKGLDKSNQPRHLLAGEK